MVDCMESFIKNTFLNGYALEDGSGYDNIHAVISIHAIICIHAVISIHAVICIYMQACGRDTLAINRLQRGNITSRFSKIKRENMFIVTGPTLLGYPSQKESCGCVYFGMKRRYSLFLTPLYPQTLRYYCTLLHTKQQQHIDMYSYERSLSDSPQIQCRKVRKKRAATPRSESEAQCERIERRTRGNS